MNKDTWSLVILFYLINVPSIVRITSFPINSILFNSSLEKSNETIVIVRRNPKETGIYLDDDMLIDMTEKENVNIYEPFIDPVAKVRIWPQGKVYYKIGPEYEKHHIDLIVLTMMTIESITCIRFIPVTENIKEGYVNITANNRGCFASIGYRKNVQILNLEIAPLNTGCFRFGTVTHELIHILGFIHQQCIPTRDDYVKIVKENIRDEMLGNFNKYPESYIGSIGLPYDYNSIMHYHSKAFSKNGKITIEPYNTKAEIGQRRGMSAKDIKKILSLYKCTTAPF